MNINSYLTSFDDTFDNIVHDTMTDYILEYKKINLYNKNIKNPCQKIWLFTPKLKMHGKINFSKKQNQIALLSLLLHEDETNNDNTLQKFIERLEKYCKSIVIEQTETKKLKLKSCIKKDNTFYPSLTLQLPCCKKDNVIQFNFDIYDMKNNKINHNTVTYGSYVRAYIEVSDLWISKKEYGINLKVLQMKVYPDFNFNQCLFDDEYQFMNDKEVNCNNYQEVSKKLTLPHPPPLKPMPRIKPFIPSVNDLLSIKLKPIKKEEENEVIKEDNQNLENKIITEQEENTENKEIKKTVLKKKKKKKKIIKSSDL